MGKKKSKDRVQEPRFHRDMGVIDALEADPRVVGILAGMGLPCDRCIVALHETLAEGCAPLGLEVDELVQNLNALEPETGAEAPGETSK